MSPLKAVFIPTEMEGTSAAGISSRCFAELSLRSCQLRRQRKRKGWTTFRSKKSFGEGSGVLLGHSRGSEGPLALLPELLSQGSPWSEQRGLCQPPVPEPQQLPTRLLEQEKSPMNVQLKKAAALTSIFGMNWRILLFQLQPTCWFSSAALLFCSPPFPGLS